MTTSPKAATPDDVRVDPPGEWLLALIGEYWNCAYAEGRDGREHDTKDGKAALLWHDIQAKVAALQQRCDALNKQLDDIHAGTLKTVAHVKADLALSAAKALPGKWRDESRVLVQMHGAADETAMGFELCADELQSALQAVNEGAK